MKPKTLLFDASETRGVQRILWTGTTECWVRDDVVGTVCLPPRVWVEWTGGRASFSRVFPSGAPRDAGSLLAIVGG